jgi:transposase InsO family protein
VRFDFVHSQREQYPLELLCRMLEVSRSGYYAWLKRQGQEPGKREKRRMELVERIHLVHEQSRRTYGSPRVYQELKALGQSVCENTVAKLMKREGIRSIVRGRFRLRTTDTSHGHPVAPNRLDRCFQRDLPNQAWCADITYIPTEEGWLYLSAVIDLCSRKVVGWSMADHLRTELCMDALDMALAQRRPGAGLLHHSDRGVQYACREYRQKLEDLGIERSMSGRGDCYDNAVAESFFKTLKVELVYHRKYATRAEAMSSIFEYIEVFYNRRRRHSSLGYMSPEEYEASLN